MQVYPFFVRGGRILAKLIIINIEARRFAFRKTLICLKTTKSRDKMMNQIIGRWSTGERKTNKTAASLSVGEIMPGLNPMNRFEDIAYDHVLTGGAMGWKEFFEFHQDSTFKNITICKGFNAETDGTTIQTGTFSISGNNLNVVTIEGSFTPDNAKGKAQKYNPNESRTYDIEFADNFQRLILKDYSPYSTFYRM